VRVMGAGSGTHLDFNPFNPAPRRSTDRTLARAVTARGSGSGRGRHCACDVWRVRGCAGRASWCRTWCASFWC